MFTILRFCVLIGLSCFEAIAAEVEKLELASTPLSKTASIKNINSLKTRKDVPIDKDMRAPNQRNTLLLDSQEDRHRFYRHRSQAESMFAQARMRLEDKNITDVSLVPTLLELSASSGYAPAQLLLLAVLEGRYIGIATEVEKARALAHFLAGAPMGDAKPFYWPEVNASVRAFAMQRLAFYAERAWGQREDAKAAFNWMRLAADTGSWPAQVELTRYLMNGYGCKAQPAKALLILKSVEKSAPDTPNLYFYYGYMCERGLGLIHPFPKEARLFYEHGVERHDARACNNLAALYERGVGLNQDLPRALMLYRVASEWGNKNALVNMQRVAGRLGREMTDQSPHASWNIRVTRALSRVLSLLPLQDSFFLPLRLRLEKTLSLDEEQFYR